MKSVKQDQSITRSDNLVKVTPEQRKVLANLMTANVFFPSVRDFIKAFNLDITAETISQDSKKLRKSMEEEDHV